MSIRVALYDVTDAVHDQYDSYPLDENEKGDVIAFLNAAGQTDTDVLFRVSRLPISLFLQVDVAQQWQDTKDALWLKIQLKSKKPDLDPPADIWGPSAILFDVAEYVSGD